MINNAREFINQEGFGTLENLGRKFNNFKAIYEECTIWVGLRPAETTLRPLWDDEPDAQKEEALDMSWESVEVMAATIGGEETERIVLTFPFEYEAFLRAIDTVQDLAEKIQGVD